MKLQHSFWFSASGQAFQQVLQHDPNCAMAYWGQALSRLDNLFIPPQARNVAEGRALLEQARQLGPKTEREAAYIEALAPSSRGTTWPGAGRASSSTSRRWRASTSASPTIPRRRSSTPWR
jgi:hypothetical protein